MCKRILSKVFEPSDSNTIINRLFSYMSTCLCISEDRGLAPTHQLVHGFDPNLGQFDMKQYGIKLLKFD